VRALDELAPQTVQQLGWAGTKNGKLLARAASEFDVLFTVDRDFAGLGDTVPHPVGVVILQVGSTDRP
jgi:predicted nuclease of predicted toxin-antitoxin system